ncbi:MAG TPA: hypothetical protein VNT26_16685 [Candidatus Sulfotelmatobacter sp.]|nr:hypothetical protein [Candidatus Sulfotelmatobacter sp.]
MGSDELELKRELSEICHKTGVPDGQPLMKAIFDWISAVTGTERAQRSVPFNRLVGEIKVQAKCFDQYQVSQEQKGMDEAREKIHQLLKDFVDKLPARK